MLFRPNLPFFRKPAHRRRILALYKEMLQTTKEIPDPVERKYLYAWIRERFHNNKRQTSPTQVEIQLSDGAWAKLVMDESIAGNKSTQKYIHDLAYGKTGLIKEVLDHVWAYSHPTKACELIRDMRPRSCRLHQPHKAYRIPLDLSVFEIPKHLEDRLKAEDRLAARKLKRNKARNEARIAQEIRLLRDAVNSGNTALRESGLLPWAFSVDPRVSHSRGDRIEGIVGNVAWIPPKIKNRIDPPLVQHVVASSGCEFLKINSRMPSHTLSAKIASTYKDTTKRLNRHEFFYYFIDDLIEEENFEERLGIEDKGYWIFAQNYRLFLRDKLKNFTLKDSIDIVNNDELSHEIDDAIEDYASLADEYIEITEKSINTACRE